MPELTKEHFAYFLETIDTDNIETMVNLLVNKIIIYPDKMVILINVTENANTPPLDQITEIMECSQNVLFVLNYAYRYNIRLKSPYYVVLHNGNSKGVCTAQLPIVLSLAVEKCYRLFLGQSRISHRK